MHVYAYLLTKGIVMKELKLMASVGLVLASTTVFGSNTVLDELDSFFGCDKKHLSNEQVCSQFDDFRGEDFIIKDTDKKGNRVIGVVYTKDRQTLDIKKSLVVADYTWSSDFHQKMYFKNQLCLFTVEPDNAEQQLLIDNAIADIESDKIPKENAAYQWGMSTSLSMPGVQCSDIDVTDSNVSLTTGFGEFYQTDSAIYVLENASNQMSFFSAVK
jgi:hypothetical protein